MGRDPDVGEDLAHVPPVHLSPGTGNHFEPPVQTRRLTGADAEFFGIRGPASWRWIPTRRQSMATPCWRAWSLFSLKGPPWTTTRSASYAVGRLVRSRG